MATIQHPVRHIARSIRQVSTRLPRTRTASTRFLTSPCCQINSPRTFSAATFTRYPGLMPDAEHPEPPKEDAATSTRTATSLTDDEYHTHADEYMEKINERAEELAEQRDDVDVEYSAGVLNITLPRSGTYVINKQPPNKQIWLSSPISGPKRYDWSVEGESMDQKEGGGSGDWIYIRDGTSLSDLLRKEVGIDVTVGDLEEQLMLKSTDPVE